ncbi:hypothetical protein HJG60_011651 [Phyllostomus discolor]|uniref:Uncharacterized protein n=1 Tax=Phyllostomus discolor TaxID=89673 RepID=A0A833ZYG0_9CHIR|nr:hypothetical protein HJG60_011651 [Phyllostomus discolor]
MWVFLVLLLAVGLPQVQMDVAVAGRQRLFPRFFYVSKQCARYCPVYASSSSAVAKSFVLEKPMPFIYVRCCRGPLCNGYIPNITEFREFREAGRAPGGRGGGGGAGLALLLALSSGAPGLGLC